MYRFVVTSTAIPATGAFVMESMTLPAIDDAGSRTRSTVPGALPSSELLTYPSALALTDTPPGATQTANRPRSSVSVSDRIGSRPTACTVA
jgi:hypothetical protein